MAEKVTIMVIKVDLQCPRCYKKIKKVLCKIPQIRDQMFDEKQNTVTITVVCCSPEKVKQKICCKGGDTIKGIEIKVPEKKKEPEKKPAPAPAPAPVVNPPKPPAPAPAPAPVVNPPKPPAPAPAPVVNPPKPPPPKPPAPEPVKVMPVPVPGYPPANPIGVCCRECYEGHTGGPCYQGYGRPVPPPPCYEGYGRPVYDSWSCACGGRRGCRCNSYCDENPSACTIM